MIVLPRQNPDGSYYISYSQVTTWKEMKSFNLSILGKLEYIRSYFFGEQFPDAGWAQFGSEVEDYVCEKKGRELFTQPELITLDKVVPLGRFQTEVKIPLFPNVFLKGFIDDAAEDFSVIRDYKTASNNSRSRYYKPDYVQLPIYAAGVREITGRLPERAEVKIIERLGNCFRMVNRRDLLSVGTQIWDVDIDVSHARVEKELAKVRATVLEISEAYKVFLKLKDIA